MILRYFETAFLLVITFGLEHCWKLCVVHQLLRARLNRSSPALRHFSEGWIQEYWIIDVVAPANAWTLCDIECCLIERRNDTETHNFRHPASVAFVSSVRVCELELIAWVVKSSILSSADCAWEPHVSERVRSEVAFTILQPRVTSVDVEHRDHHNREEQEETEVVEHHSEVGNESKA